MPVRAICPECGATTIIDEEISKKAVACAQCGKCIEIDCQCDVVGTDSLFTDSQGARLAGNRKLVCELTVRNGKVVYDLNGITRPDWDTLPKDYGPTGDRRWDAITPGRGMAPRPPAK